MQIGDLTDLLSVFSERKRMHEREDEWEALREAALRNQALIHTPLPPSMLKPAPPRTMSPFELSEASEADISNGIDHSLQAVANAGQAMDDTSITSAEDQEDEHGDLQPFSNTAARNPASASPGNQPLHMRVRDRSWLAIYFAHSALVAAEKCDTAVERHYAGVGATSVSQDLSLEQGIACWRKVVS